MKFLICHDQKQHFKRSNDQALGLLCIHFKACILNLDDPDNIDLNDPIVQTGFLESVFTKTAIQNKSHLLAAKFITTAPLTALGRLGKTTGKQNKSNKIYQSTIHM